MKVSRLKLGIGQTFINLQAETEEALKEICDIVNREYLNSNATIHIEVPSALKPYAKNLTFPSFVIFSFVGKETTKRIEVDEEDIYKVIEEYVKIVETGSYDTKKLIDIGREAISYAETNS